jgi:hypothetical protein
MGNPTDWVDVPGFVTFLAEMGGRDIDVIVIENPNGSLTVKDRMGATIDGVAAITTGIEEREEPDSFRLLQSFLAPLHGQRWVGIWLRCGEITLIGKDASGEIQGVEAENRARTLAREGLGTDGEDHKQWYLEEILKALGGTLDYDNHERGIAP